MNASARGERVALEFGRLLARLHEELGGPSADAASVANWARLAWLGADAGHACVDVEDAAERAVLERSPVVGAAHAAGTAPLILDLDALYLHRLWRAERALAGTLAALEAPAPLATAPLVDAAIAQVFDRPEDGDAQQHVLRLAFGHRLAIVSGGPGTGKTTTLARLLVAYARLAPDARVAFAAPTGKAAARLAQSLSSQLALHDPAGALRARLPSAGTTVHRLLGLRPGAEPASVPALDQDLVIVDEASMLDLELAAALASAIGPHARLILAGDRDQLASVEAGAVFADVCASAGDAVVELTRNYRQHDAPHIVALASQVRDGPGGADGAIDWPAEIGLRVPDAHAIVEQALDAWGEAREAIAAGAPPERVLAICDRHRVLSALREGPLGSLALNRAIAAAVRRGARATSIAGARMRGVEDEADAAASAWYAGRLVMVRRNEPGLGLFNGDVGVCLPASNRAGCPEWVVAFDGPTGARLFPVLQVPDCEDAWVVTVHKSQGSEFESVALVPAPPGHELNTRELVYTGITRARSRLCVWSTPEAIAQAAALRTRRRGRLSLRLQHARASSIVAAGTAAGSAAAGAR